MHAPFWHALYTQHTFSATTTDVAIAAAAAESNCVPFSECSNFSTLAAVRSLYVVVVVVVIFVVRFLHVRENFSVAVVVVVAFFTFICTNFSVGFFYAFIIVPFLFVYFNFKWKLEEVL